MRYATIMAAMVAACSTGSGSGKGGGSKDATATDATGASETADTGGSPVSTVTPGSGCVQLGKALCQLMSQCGGAAIESLAGTLSYCEKLMAHECAQQVALPGAGLTDSSAASCASSASSTSCAALLSGGPPSACTSLASGHLSDGSPCSDDGQCSGGNCNRMLADGDCGLCEKTVPKGGVCDAGKECSSGLECTHNDVCVTPATSGQPCGDDMACADGLGCKAGTCTSVPIDAQFPKKPAPGEACDPEKPGIFLNGRCRADARCDKEQKKCVPRSDEGGPCALEDECMPGLDCIGGKCAFAAAPVCQ